MECNSLRVARSRIAGDRAMQRNICEVRYAAKGSQGL